MNSQLDVLVSVEIHNISSAFDCKDCFIVNIKRINEYFHEPEFSKNHQDEKIEVSVSRASFPGIISRLIGFLPSVFRLSQMNQTSKITEQKHLTGQMEMFYFGF